MKTMQQPERTQTTSHHKKSQETTIHSPSNRGLLEQSAPGMTAQPDLLSPAPAPARAPTLTAGPIQAKKKGDGKVQRQNELEAMNDSYAQDDNGDKFAGLMMGAGDVDTLKLLQEKTWMKDFSYEKDGESSSMDLLAFAEGLSSISSGTADKTMLEHLNAFEALGAEGQTQDAKSALVKAMSFRLNKDLGNSVRETDTTQGIRADEGNIYQIDQQKLSSGPTLRSARDTTRHLSNLNQGIQGFGTDFLGVGEGHMNYLGGIEQLSEKMQAYEDLQRDGSEFVKFGTDISSMGRKDRLLHPAYYKKLVRYQKMTADGATDFRR